MRTIYFEKTGSVDDLQMGDLPEPKTDSKNKKLLKLQFRAGALNHLDLWVLKGLPRVKYEFPHTVGADFCGEVVESKDSKFKKKDRVILYPAEGSAAPENLSPDFKIRGENTQGVFADFIWVDSKYVFKAPEHLSDEEAAALPLVYVTAWQMLSGRGELSENFKDKEIPILIHGAGSGVSQALLELLLAMKFKNITLTSREAGKLTHWKDRGIQTWLSEHFLSQKEKRFQIIFDHVGEKFFEANIRSLEKNGKLITCGATSGPLGHLDLRHLYFRQLQLLGSTMGSLKHFKEMLNFVEKKKIRPQIAKSFAFEEVQEAYRLMERGEQDGKIILVQN